jgi:WD40 repeat protein
MIGLRRRSSGRCWPAAGVCLAVMLAVPAVVSAGWFSSVREKKPAAPLSYAAVLADDCHAPADVAVTPLETLPGADADKRPVIYPQIHPSADNIAFSPDERYLAVSDGRNIRLWDRVSGRQAWTVLAHPKAGLIFDLAFSPDNRKLYSLSGDGQGILVLDPATGRVVDRLAFGAGPFPGQLGQVFSARGTVALLKGDKQSSVLVNLENASRIAELKGMPLAISPNGRLVVTYDYLSQEWHLWDGCTGRKRRTVKATGGQISAGALSPDGRRFALWTQDAYRVVVFDTDSGKPVWEGPAADGSGGGIMPSCLRLCFSGDGRHLFFSGSYPAPAHPSGWSVLVLDAGTGAVVKAFTPRIAGIGVAVTPDGGQIAANLGGKIVFLDGQTLAPLSTLQGYARAFPFSIHPDGRIVTPYPQWDFRTAQPIKSFGLSEDALFEHVSLSSDGKVLTTIARGKGGAAGRIIHWDTRTGKALKTIALDPPPPGHRHTVQVLGYRSGGRYLAVINNLDSADILDIETGERVSGFSPIGADIWQISFTEDDTFFAALQRHASSGKTAIVIYEARTGQMLRELDLEVLGADFIVGRMAFSPDGGRLLLTGGYSGGGDSARVLLDTRSNAVVWKHTEPFQQYPFGFHPVVSPDGKTALLTRNSQALIVDMASGDVLRTFQSGLGISARFDYSPDGARVYGSEYVGGSIHIWDVTTGEELARMIEFTGAEWLSMTPEGYYAASEKGDQYLNVRVGLRVEGIGQYYEVFYRPDLVAENLEPDVATAGPPAPTRNILQVAAAASPPRVRFQSPVDNSALAVRDVEIVADIIDTGGGIGTATWKINGVTVGVTDDAGRGIAVSGTGAPQRAGVPLKRLLTLSPGENVIQVTVKDATGDVVSEPAVLHLTCRDEISATPSLYLLTVGINQYRDGALRLNYSVPDARSISEAFTARSKRIFPNVVIEQVFDQDATSAGLEAMFAKLSRKVQTQDVFVFYVAGHGVAQDGRYHLLPYDFRYRNEASIRESGITQDQLQKWLAGIPARKSLVLMDTCNSGAFTQGKAVQRGIAEKTAINRLTRATGRAIIVASKDDQPAMEGYKGHGVFTYVLLNAFTEADTVFGNSDGQTSIFEVAAYVDTHVPEITFKQFGYEQVPQVNMQGRDFPIADTP